MTERGIVIAGGVIFQRPTADGRILITSDVALERFRAHGSVNPAGRIAIQCVIAERGDACGCGETEKCIFTLRRILSGIPTVRRWINCQSHRRNQAGRDAKTK